MPRGGVLARFYRSGDRGFELSFCLGDGAFTHKKIALEFCPGGWSSFELTKALYTILQKKSRGGSRHRPPPPPPPPPIIFERQILPQQTIYHWKGNLAASRFNFKCWGNILKYEHIIYIIYHFKARGLEISNI